MINIFKTFTKKAKNETADFKATVPAPEAAVEPVVVAPTAIASFLTKFNYEDMGKKEGYLYPSNEVLDKTLNMLRSEYRLAVDKMMDGARTEIGNLKLHIINTRGLGQDLEDSLQEKMEQLENLIAVLDNEKVLSIEGEGKIAPVLQAYRCGFLKGVERYNQEKFIAHSTNLF